MEAVLDGRGDAGLVLAVEGMHGGRRLCARDGAVDGDPGAESDHPGADSEAGEAEQAPPGQAGAPGVLRGLRALGGCLVAHAPPT